ncbi:O-methylsterigmatocystin oxidoreductase [Coprinopsis sp. MPI-PUGE-AT-0042]|nr:O-methylsterigmatocystin oxidoreductase [Coprinopsis sp. MPI-PUGE-AT-0042]
MENIDSLLLSPRFLLLALGIGGWSLWSILARRQRNPRGLPLPPGPKGIPVLGNALQIAQGKSWETYRDWSRHFGDIIYIEVMGTPILVLNSIKATNDLLEKKGSNFSDRVHMPSLDMLEMGWNFGLADYGPYWKENRRIFHQYYNPSQIAKYHPVLEQQSRLFFQRLASDPQDFKELTKYFFGAVVMQISYGVNDPDYTSKLIDDAEKIQAGFALVSEPGRFLVDTFPFLRFVPSWFPGAHWKRILEEYGARGKDVYERMFEDAMTRARNGIQGQHANVADDVISTLPASSDPTYEMKKEQARNVTLIAYIAGVDSTNQSARALYLALAMHPEAQKRAQEELERVVGVCRLPKPSDISKLPYLNALVKEVSRWHSVSPLGTPHRVREDDEYNGYFIPKGTMVFGNAWAIMHDPATFEDPLEFRPERYLKDGHLDPSVLDAEAAAFGFGRRICPGRHLSNEALKFMAASLLSVFDVSPGKDAAGNPLPLKYDTGTEIFPKLIPFEVHIQVRSTEHAALLTEY